MTPLQSDIRTAAQRTALSPSRFLEENYSLVDVLGMRRGIQIEDNAEPLIALPEDTFALNVPHAYVRAGAPYGAYSPFCLRAGVVDRLLQAQNYLDDMRPGHRLLILDGFRPTAVQEYMVELTFRQLAEKKGLHEWWHFSCGDQMWALLTSLEQGRDVVACYGCVTITHA